MKIKKGYKNTELGLIPEEWNIKKLYEVSVFLDGKRKPVEEKERGKINGIYPYYGASGIIDWVNGYLFDDELILLGEDGANILFRNSPLAFKVTGKIWVNNHAHVIKPNQDINIDYLTNYLESIDYKKYNSGTAQPKLNLDNCKKIKIPVPPLPEQKKIAKILSTWDKAIENTEKLLEAKTQLKKGLMQKLLTGKIRFKEFENEKWSQVNLGEVTELFSRRNKKLNGARIYSVTNNNGFVFQSDHFSREVAGDDLTNYKIIKKNEFAYNPARINVGSIAHFKDEIGVISSLYVCFRTTKDLLDEYMSYLLQIESTKFKIRNFGEGGVRVYLWYPLFATIKVVIPNIKEQEKISFILQTLDKELEIIKSQLIALKEQKKGLMQKLLTGEVRVVIEKC